MLETRVCNARHLVTECRVDAILFCSLPNLRYLTGFSGTDGVAMVTESAVFFLCDSRYTTQARTQVAADEIREYKVKLDGVLELARQHEWRSIGFEADILPYAVYDKFKEQGAEINWVPLTRQLAALRGCKGADELELLDRAAQLNAEALEEILPLLRPGARECDIAFELEIALRRRGGEEKAFDFIVASGERGAMPHGVASTKVLQAGELVTVDFGTRFGGYHSDETLTFALGEVSPRLREIYDCVLEAHDRAIEAVRPGQSLRDIDAVARDFIAARGFGDYFGHGLGHGLGLEVHEYPTASPRSEHHAVQGMVFTVEPGIYIPGLGGVRIEDTILVTADGCRKITKIPKDFRVLPV
ncbi:M24 family metallopeptidase [Geoalkalibacter halelectricus]|uniref:Xaa-Pro peptidase family protein n=1 Tax=Geoalkalibacter halelectricus TaxID=2847045 RepID=A0ABY5ZTV1_9BACT|nr:Xaa-Pro peptidase family protein [Geoalkalibacter halelectricus]MDO3376759.1 Xaa-Pro peptidase family protein [Geoalkalibacter halelectricus]UWZ81290.1 Xaa-Pro peptidase family protein [Geoalkalibacter halelectricus]